MMLGCQSTTPPMGPPSTSHTAVDLKTYTTRLWRRRKLDLKRKKCWKHHHRKSTTSDCNLQSCRWKQMRKKGLCIVNYGSKEHEWNIKLYRFIWWGRELWGDQHIMLTSTSEEIPAQALQCVWNQGTKVLRYRWILHWAVSTRDFCRLWPLAGDLERDEGSEDWVSSWL